MKIVTSQKLVEKYGEGVMSLVKRLGNDIEVLPTSDCQAAKSYIDTINDDILIFGGPDVIQFFTLLNPASDPDTDVASDNPYACVKDKTNLIPDKAVSRLPDEQINWSIDYIDKLTQTQVNLTNTHTGWHNIVASVWKSISDYTGTMFNMGLQNVVPPDDVHTLQQLWLQTNKFFLVNLHGGRTVPGFYGQINGTYPLAISPVEGMFKDCLVYSEACYGAYLDGRDRQGSIALMSLFSGCAAFIGSTRVAFGPPAPPARCADLLGEKLYARLLQGQPLGTAFFNAKQDFATETIQCTGSLDPEAKLTLLEFVCYGNPQLMVN